MQVIKNHEFNFKQLENDIDTLKDGIKERDEAMQTMTKTLVEKGETNRRLSETVNTIKNQYQQLTTRREREEQPRIPPIKRTGTQGTYVISMDEVFTSNSRTAFPSCIRS